MITTRFTLRKTFGFSRGNSYTLHPFRSSLTMQAGHYQRRALLVTRVHLITKVSFSIYFLTYA